MNNNPIGIEHRSSSARGNASRGMVNSLTLGESIVPGWLSINTGFYWPNLDFLEQVLGTLKILFQ